MKTITTHRTQSTIRSVATLLLLAWANPSLAQDEIRGQVKSSGSPSERRTFLVPAKNQDPIQLCDGGKRFQITQLPGSIISAKGHLMRDGKSQNACFFPESFAIEEIALGRTAIIGELRQVAKNTYAIISDEGRMWKLSALSPGNKILVGQEVVADLIADSFARRETTWLVARINHKP